MPNPGIVPKGEALRQAIRWLGEHGDHSVLAIEEAARRFDLSPAEEAFMLAHFRTSAKPAPDQSPGRSRQ